VTLVQKLKRKKYVGCPTHFAEMKPDEVREVARTLAEQLQLNYQNAPTEVIFPGELIEGKKCA